MARVDEPQIWSYMKRTTFKIGIRVLAGFDIKSPSEFEDIYSTFRDLVDNVMSVPLNIPGMGYNTVSRTRFQSSCLPVTAKCLYVNKAKQADLLFVKSSPPYLSSSAYWQGLLCVQYTILTNIKT